MEATHMSLGWESKDKRIAAIHASKCLDVNAKFAVPTLVEALQNLAKSQNDEVIKSRFETLSLLLRHIDNPKMWETILKEAI
jgi:hypothetical protein